MAVTLKPRDFKRSAIEEVAIPFPIPEMTPPETKIIFGLAIKKAPQLGSCTCEHLALRIVKLNLTLSGRSARQNYLKNWNFLSRNAFLPNYSPNFSGRGR